MGDGRIEFLEQDPSPYIDGPSEFLVKQVCAEILKVPQFKGLFGEFVTPYMRMDYPIRALPVLRIYNNTFVKEFDSWFITGDLTMDVIYPASLRREETEFVQDTVSSALLQQFRRMKFFTAVEAKVPGLNELGKTFTVDKSLGFRWGEDVVPLTRIVVNFKIDLREWDQYLEIDSRTKEDPFERTLANLERMVGVIQGLNDAQAPKVEVGIDQKI